MDAELEPSEAVTGRWCLALTAGSGGDEDAVRAVLEGIDTDELGALKTAAKTLSRVVIGMWADLHVRRGHDLVAGRVVSGPLGRCLACRQTVELMDDVVLAPGSDEPGHRCPRCGVYAVLPIGGGGASKVESEG